MEVTVMSAPVPTVLVTPSQLAAATVIHDEFMPGWAGTDRALTLLANCVPGLDADAITLKAAAVDRLYYTNLFWLDAAVDNITEVVANLPVEPVEVIERIAPLSVKGKTKRCWSFSSKFGHWFIDDSLPIYDQWAIRAIGYHFDKITWEPTAYRDFAQHVYALKEASGLSCTTRELDRHLWLAGQYRSWSACFGDPDKRKKLGLSGAAQDAFRNENPDLQQALRTILGDER
jgi:hypothetical protein